MTGSVAHLVATYLRGEGIERVFGLCGGHIQPMWDAVARSGIDIVDVRHEGAAVFMAHAAGEVTGTVGVAMVTAGPGVTNAATGIANLGGRRSVARHLGEGAAAADRDGRHAGR